VNLRVFNQRFFEPGAQLLMIVGIVCLCQPWVAWLHLWSVAIMLAGLVAFNVAAHIPPPLPRIDEDDTGAISVGETVQEGRGHG
jgi:hypothetical protein